MLTPVLALSVVAALPSSVPLELFEPHSRGAPPSSSPAAALPGARARIDLGGVAGMLRGSFIESSLGGLLGPLTVDDKGMRVARLGYGVYLGRPWKPRRGELSVHYELERRGLIPDERDVRAMPWYARRGLGVEGTIFFTPNVGLHFSASVGKAWSAGVGLVLGGF